MRIPRGLLLAALIAAMTVFAAGCGGGSDTSTDASQGIGVADVPAPPASDFPATDRDVKSPANRRRSLAALLSLADGPSSLVVAPASMVFHTGENRYSFGVFTREMKPVNDAEVAIYVAKVPDGLSRVERAAAAAQNIKAGEPVGGTGGASEASAPGDAQTALKAPAFGPYPAAFETLATEGAFRAQTTADDPDAASGVYVTHLNFTGPGEWRIGALITENGKITASLAPSAIVGEFKQVPAAGDMAPRIHTPTLESVGGDAKQVTTRIPPDTQNTDDLYNVLGQKPVVLLFATPQFCTSRTCGPVTDITEQLKAQHEGDDISFIHVEIYNNNDPNDGFRPQVRAFHLPSEPWLFVIDKDGVISTAIEGAFGVNEAEAAVQGVLGDG